MTIEILLLIIMSVILLATIGVSTFERIRMLDSFSQERHKLVEQHNVERSELLNRLQAGSFVEYKQMEIATIKADKKETPQPQYQYEEV